MTPLAPLMTNFLRTHLPKERGLSPHTCDTYAHAFRLFFIFAADKIKVRPSELCIEQISSDLVLEFLADIENGRKNSASTRNARLAAIKSFMRFVEFKMPSVMEQVRQIQLISTKRGDSRLIKHLTLEEVQAILNAPNLKVRLGIRDRAMLHLCFSGGLRVSELVELPLQSVSLQKVVSIKILGKGRRERCLPLWKDAAKDLRAWLAIRGEMPSPELFVNADGKSVMLSFT
jgi:integrase/recombinase XerD